MSKIEAKEFDSAVTGYTWNPKRKLWHVFGCGLILLLFFLYADYSRPLMVLVAFQCSMLITIMEFVRLRSEIENQTFKNIFGSWLRKEEESGFNASFYYLWGTFFLALTCSDPVIVMAVCILGIADPLSAFVRYEISKRKFRYVTQIGLLVFVTSAFVCGEVTSNLMRAEFSWAQLLFIAAFVGSVESFTKHVVALFRPFVARMKKVIGVQWIYRLYPDDNFTILVATAGASGLAKIL
ncbi:MAG: hypothetical protein NUW37_09925 [Planctomycetes bacterium]|nr:hypothetical protein [Planctomycetota bacterium]